MIQAGIKIIKITVQCYAGLTIEGILSYKLGHRDFALNKGDYVYRKIY